MKSNNFSIKFEEPKIFTNPYSNKWKFWPICKGSNLHINLSFLTSQRAGTGLVLYAAGIQPGKPFLPRLVLCISIEGKWKLTAESKSLSLAHPINHGSKSKINLQITIKKDPLEKTIDIYFSPKKTRKPTLIFKSFPVDKDVFYASFMLPPGNKSQLSLFNLQISGDDLAIDRRVV